MMMEKREIFRTCLEDFDYDTVAEYGEADIQRIMGTPDMSRSRRKIKTVINDARCFQQICEEYGSFSETKAQIEIDLTLPDRRGFGCLLEGAAKA